VIAYPKSPAIAPRYYGAIIEYGTEYRTSSSSIGIGDRRSPGSSQQDEGDWRLEEMLTVVEFQQFQKKSSKIFEKVVDKAKRNC